MLHSSVLRCGTALSKDRRVFQACAAATGNARSPSVKRHCTTGLVLSAVNYLSMQPVRSTQPSIPPG